MNYSRALYEKRKSQGLCVGCGKVPPIKGQVRCEQCAELSRACAKRFYDGRKELVLAAGKIRYERLKEQHICVKCKKRNARPGRVLCSNCAGILTEEERLQKYPSITFECAYCHKQVTTDSTQRPDKRTRFCSAACADKWWRKNYK